MSVSCALYLVKRIGPTDYDESAGFVIAASSPADARSIAYDQETTYGKQFNLWLRPEFATCKRIAKLTTEPRGIVLQDFRAG